MTAAPQNTTPRLPYDILVTILDGLGRDGNKKALKNCSLLRHDLLPHCRKYIFGTFDMRDRNLPATGEFVLAKFIRLLSESPHLSEYVRNVHILDLHSDDYSPVSSRMLLPSLLRVATHITSFGLHLGRGTTWTKIAPELRTSITDLSAQSRCIELSLTNIQKMPISFLNRWQFSKSWTFKLCSFVSEETLSPSALQAQSVAAQRKPAASDRPIRTKAISLLECESLITKLDHPSVNVDFSTLNKLDLTFTFPTLQATWDLIHLTRNTLEILNTRQAYSEHQDQRFSFPAIVSFLAYPDHSSSPLLPYVTLAALTRLSCLSFTVFLPGQDELDANYSEHLLKDWCLLLRTSPPYIAKVAITFDFFFSCMEAIDPLFEGFRSRQRKTSTFLTELDEILANPGIFPSLSEVRIEVLLPDDRVYTSDSEYSLSGDPPDPMMPDEIEYYIKQMMKTTRKRLRTKNVNGFDAFEIDVRVGS